MTAESFEADWFCVCTSQRIVGSVSASKIIETVHAVSPKHISRMCDTKIVVFASELLRESDTLTVRFTSITQ